MNISKAIKKKTWILLYKNKSVYIDPLGVHNRTSRPCYVGIDECRKNGNCYGKGLNVNNNDIIRMEYKTVVLKNEYYGELSFGINDNELKSEFEYIPIDNNQIYNLFVGFTETVAAVQLLE
eukprot:UN08211